MTKDLREQLKILRATKNLTQQELGEILGVSDSTLSDYERGKTKKIPEDIANKIQRMLDEEPTVYPVSLLYEEFKKCADEMGWKLTSDDYMALAYCEIATDYIYGKTCYAWIYEALSGNGDTKAFLRRTYDEAEDYKTKEAAEELIQLDRRIYGYNNELVNKISVSKSVAHILKEKYKDGDCVPLWYKESVECEVKKPPVILDVFEDDSALFPNANEFLVEDVQQNASE